MVWPSAWPWGPTKACSSSTPLPLWLPGLVGGLLLWRPVVSSSPVQAGSEAGPTARPAHQRVRADTRQKAPPTLPSYHSLAGP